MIAGSSHRNQYYVYIAFLAQPHILELQRKHRDVENNILILYGLIFNNTSQRKPWSKPMTTEAMATEEVFGKV